jgi:transcriptional regulator with XRE-family HTH domain
MSTIRDLRTLTGESQLDLALAIGVHSQTVAGWEAGQHDPTVQLLRRVADHFGVTMDDIDLLAHEDGRLLSGCRRETGTLRAKAAVPPPTASPAGLPLLKRRA